MTDKTVQTGIGLGGVESRGACGKLEAFSGTAGAKQ